MLESGRDGMITGDAQLAVELTGFATGLAVAAVLLGFALRAARLPSTPVSVIVLAACGVAWNLGGLAQAAFLVAGATPESRLSASAAALQFTAGAIWPIPLIQFWGQLTRPPRHRRVAGILHRCALLSAVVAVLLLWSAVFFPTSREMFALCREFTAYSAALLIVPAAIFLLRPARPSLVLRLSSLAIVVSVSFAATALVLSRIITSNPQLTAALLSASKQVMLIGVWSIFFQFPKFRFADLFVRQALRLVLVMVWALGLLWLLRNPLLPRLCARAAFPGGLQVALELAAAAILLMLLILLESRASAFVSGCLFRVPDYPVATRLLIAELARSRDETEVARCVEASVRNALQPADVRLVDAATVPGVWLRTDAGDAGIVQLAKGDADRQGLPCKDADFIVPVVPRDRATHALVIASAGGASLFTHELTFLQTVAVNCARRLDALGREQELLQQYAREALLLRQLTEAELRALRAQINPHFLFNALTTLTDLIARDPCRAETMTLRLARVFRYVLTHSSQHVTSLQDEIDFLRSYLYLEEARFGDRLRVSIDVAPEVSGDHIPSLILQPLVENALKHGLGPKPGPGHISILAYAGDDHVHIVVEDDGVGAKELNLGERRGVGLTNVAERLRTLYGDAATMRFEPRIDGGTRVTLIIPRGALPPCSEA